MAKSKKNRVSISKKKQNYKRKSLSRRKVMKNKKGGAIGYRLNMSDCGLGGKRAIVDAYTTNVIKL